MIPVNIVLGTLGAFLIMLIVIRCDEVMKDEHISALEDLVVDKVREVDQLEKQIKGVKK